jgi:diacylglycerol kinase family enzyme
MPPVIPAFLNPAAGTAAPAAAALERDPRFRLVRLPPGEIAAAVAEHVRGGGTRIVVAGGDGSVAAGAAAAMKHGAELAVVPAGTLNHFARGLGIPTEPAAALDVAAGGATRAVDVGFVNGRLFLNTSSVGAYVALVHVRRRLQPYVGYHLAGALAALVQLVRLRRVTLEVETPEGRHDYRTPLVFVGVGERDLRLAAFGERVRGGRPALHAVVVRGGGRARLLALALATARHGIWRVARTPHVDSFLVERCRVAPRRPTVNVALDGEIHRLDAPLDYRIASGALTVVAPASGAIG